MTQKKSTEAVLTEITELFGPPPVLSTEDIEAYNKIMAEFIELFRPTDTLEQSFIKDLTDATWEMRRYRRHKDLAIQRRFQQRLAYQAQRAKLLAQRETSRAQE